MLGTRTTRFSLLLLEEGEQYLHDWTASAEWPEGFAKAHAKSTEAGRLRLCSKSIFFEPDQAKLPITRIPFTHVQELEFTDSKSFRIISTMLTTMRPNNLDVPYGTHKGKAVSWQFSLPYAPLDEFMLQAQKQLALSRLPRAEREDLLQAEKFDQAKATAFDTSRLVDFSEEIVCDAPAVLHSPLTTSPGRLVISPQRLYFQPKHDITGHMPCHSHPLSLVAAISRRRAVLRPTGLEVFFAGASAHEAIKGPFWGMPSAFFAFATQATRDSTLSVLKEQGSLATGLPGGEQAAKACPDLLEAESEWPPRVQAAWQAGHISNFAYLLYLNLTAGRSLNDLGQWPIFPWVLCDFRQPKLDLNDSTMFRDLSKPVGALNPKRLAMLTTRFQEMPRGTGCDPPFMYGTHYSCPGYVMFWMVRAAPGHLLRLQNGRFDSPDRMFCDLAEAWDSVMSNPTDVKELIPEFFLSDVRFLQNLDSLPLGTRQNGRPVGDVKLPAWAQSPADFLRKHRAALESAHVSAHLHEWIDLIFGFKQQGAEAEKAGNVFHHLTYEGGVDLDSITDAQERQAVEAQINEFGQCPAQLFPSPHPPKTQAALTSAADGSANQEQDAHQALASALIMTILAAAKIPTFTVPDTAASAPRPHAPSAKGTESPASPPLQPALVPDRSPGSWTSRVGSARRWSGQLSGQLGSLMDGLAQKGQQAGLSPDALKGMFKRPAAQPSSQQKDLNTRSATTASAQNPNLNTKQALPSAPEPPLLSSSPAAQTSDQNREPPSAWDTNLLAHLKSLTVLPSQGVSINGMCLHYVGDTPAQICALESGTLKAVSLLDGSQLRSLQLGEAPLTSLALQPQDKQMGGSPSFIFAGSQSSQVHAANISAASSAGSWQAHRDTISCLGFLPGSLATASWDCSVKVWKLDEGREPWSSTFPIASADMDDHEAGIWAMACEPERPCLMTGTEEGVLTCWDLRQNKSAWQVKTSSDYISDISLAESGLYLSVAAASSGLLWLDCRNVQRPSASLRCPSPARRCKTDGLTVLAALEDGKVRSWQPLGKSLIHRSSQDCLQADGCPASMAAEELMIPGSNSHGHRSLYLVIGTDAGQSSAWMSVE
ncbi:hypothetical protein WJX74_006071 [Apatococcus lobatus]|uniref:Protein FAN n=1 Tax=Apatococcus lobatus TaxID=904363 RepID=A0AAW1QW22_9CHLO